MDRHEALKALSSDSWHQRLKAARSLGVSAAEEDLSALQTALAVETVSYVRRFLDSALRRVRRDLDDARAGQAENLPPSVMRQVYARAVGEVTRTILHEVETIAGAIALAASREMDPYAGSRTEAQINRLNTQLEAINHLKAAAAAPRISKFSLGTWVKTLVDEEGLSVRSDVSLVGSDSLLVDGDPKLLRLAVCNGLKNAVDAVNAAPPRPNTEARIVVSWDATDVECWITIVDDGLGLSGAAAEALPLGRTTKVGHPGMGLMIAKQAMDSLEGELSLSPAAHGGALFEVRWFGS